MDVIGGLTHFNPGDDGIVLTIGNFDGVHRGHAGLIETARNAAARLALPVVAMTFHPHPLAALNPERAPALLTTLRERLALLERLGVERCIVQRSTPAFLGQEAADFLASLVAHCQPRAFVEGPGFNFGRGRTGSVATLIEHAESWGYEVHALAAVRCAELPTNPLISSSSIRQALVDGRVEEAAAMLGRPYRVVGTIGTGAGRGADMGFPTANLDGIVHSLPQEAVYAAAAQLDDGELVPAAVNVGPQPTFAQDRSRVEAYLLGVDRNLRGRRIGLHFLSRLREQSKFAGPEELKAQLRRDVEATRRRAGQVEALSRLTRLPL